MGMGLGYFSITISYIKAMLEIMLYIAAIFLAIKAIKALNIYIDKN